MYTKLITRKYETTGTGTLAGRPAGFMIGDSADPDADYDLTYAYDPLSRLHLVAGPGLPTGFATYWRLADSNLVQNMNIGAVFWQVIQHPQVRNVYVE